MDQFVPDQRRHANLVPRQLGVAVSVPAQGDHPVHDAVKGAAHPLWVPCELHRPTVWAGECGYRSTTVATTRSAVVSVRRTALAGPSSPGLGRRPGCPRAFRRRYHRSRTRATKPCERSQQRDRRTASRQITSALTRTSRSYTPRTASAVGNPDSPAGHHQPRPAATYVSISSSVGHTIAIGTQPFRAPPT